MLQAISRSTSLPGGKETILLAEDAAPLRRTTSMFLRRLGYTVIETCNPGEALEKWKEQRESIKLVLTDMVMSDQMSGLDLGIRLQEQQPGLCVILTSGYSTELVAGTLPPGITFVSKPFQPAALAVTIRELLDRSAPAQS